MSRIDEFYLKPNAIQDLESPRAAADIDDNFDAIYLALQKIRDEVNAIETGGGAAGGANDLLDGSVHQDTVAAAATPGALIAGSAASLWDRFALGTVGQFLRVAVGPVLSWVSVTAADFLHDLLSAAHPDTEPASPVLGDLIVADHTTVGATDDSRFWLHGAPLEGIAGALSPGGNQFWLNGEPMDALLTGTVTSPVSWRRLPVGNQGQVPVVHNGRLAYQSIAGLSTGQGARVYRSSNFSLVWGTPTVITFDTVERDDAGYYSSGAPTRFTVASAGWYAVVGQVAANYSQFGPFELALRVNGAARAVCQSQADNVNAAFGTTYDSKQVSGLLYLNAGDHVELYAVGSRTSMASMACIGGAAATFLSLVKVG